MPIINVEHCDAADTLIGKFMIESKIAIRSIGLRLVLEVALIESA